MGKLFKLKKAAAAVLCAVFCLLGGATTLSGAVYAESVPDFNIEVNSPPHIVFMGDSIAAGYGLDGYSPDNKGQCASYANILSEVFDSALPEEAEFSSVNVAIDGLTSKGLLKRLKEGVFDEQLKNADALVLSIGGNDLLLPLIDIFYDDNSFSEMVDELFALDELLDERLVKFSENLPQIVGEIYDRNESEDFQLFVQTLYNPFEDHFITPLANLALDKIGKLNEIIVNSADECGYTLADIASVFEGGCKELTNIKSMDIHPNADGHSLIAKTIQPLICEKTYTYYSPSAEAEYRRRLAKEQELAKRREERMKVVRLYAAGGAAAAVILAISVISYLRKNKAKTA
ncbi:MAG: SGNH/GDSL hydrolase family protein [Oscillospiraceae bacterium]